MQTHLNGLEMENINKICVLLDFFPIQSLIWISGIPLEKTKSYIYFVELCKQASHILKWNFSKNSSSYKML
jgi:hypothetical protein